MDTRQVGNIQVKARYENDGSITFFVQRQTLVWRDGKWTDGNRGPHYLHHAMREEIERTFNLNAND